MRVVWKAGNVIVGVIAAEGIEHQKGVQPLLQVLRQDSGQAHARAVLCGLASDPTLDRAQLGLSHATPCSLPRQWPGPGFLALAN